MKIFKLAIPVIAAGVLSAVSLNAAAEGMYSDSHVYLGGGVGYSLVNGEDYTPASNDIDKEHASWKGIVGIKFNSVFAIEGQYIDFGAANQNTDEVKASGWTAGVALDLLQSKPVTPYVKVGALFWETDSRFSSISRNADGTDLTYGLGLRFNLGENLAIRTEYERFDMDTTTIDNASVALQFNF